MQIASAVLAALRSHAASVYPSECCGVVVSHDGEHTYLPCRNLSPTPQDDFVLCPKDWADAEEKGQVIAVCHSHPDAASLPSSRDLAMCSASGLPWYILAWPEGDLRRIEPAVAPLLARPFIHGVWDCYAVCRDWYRQEWDLELPDFAREDGWWEGEEELYLDNFTKAGFVAIPEATEHWQLQPGDGLLMQIRSSRVNHAAIYLGDGNILHHLYGRLSRTDVFGGYWQRATRVVVRHQSRIPG